MGGARRRDIEVVVLGAGLTGLSTSMFLRKAGVPHRIVEREGHVGGHATTLEEAGYRFDRTGHLLHLRDPEIRAFVDEAIGMQCVEVARDSAVWSNGVYTAYPFQANVFGLPPRVAYECVLGFVRAQAEKASLPAPRNFEEFCLRHFGEGIARHFMIPYNTRLWGVSPRDITAEWCARFVPIPTLEDVLRGAFGVEREALGYNARFLYPRTGIHALCDAIAERSNPVETSTTPARIHAADRRIVLSHGGVEEDATFTDLVSTLPLPRLVELIEDAPATVKEAAGRLRWTELHYLDVALNTPCEKPLHWVYVPEDRYPFYRVGAYSNFSSSMAPVGKGCLYVELVDRAPPDVRALLPVVADALVEMGLVRSPEAIRFARARRIPFAYVIFDHAYFDSVATIHAWLASVRIRSTGRYGAWNYSSMEDAITMGRDAARAVAETAGGPPGGPR